MFNKLVLILFITSSVACAMQPAAKIAQALELWQLTVDRKTKDFSHLTKEQANQDVSELFTAPESQVQTLEFGPFLLIGFKYTSGQDPREKLKRCWWFNEKQLAPMRRAKLQGSK